MAAGPPLAPELSEQQPPASAEPRASPRSVLLAASALVVVVLAAVAALLPVPYVILSPGPLTNTLGSVRGTELITVSGRPTYPTGGHLDLTTVSVSGGPGRSLDLVSVLRGWLDPDVAVIPQEQVYPPGATKQEVQAENERDMTTSQDDATAAALRALGIEVIERATVASVAAGTPAEGVLQTRDVLVSIDGQPVSDPAQVARLIGAVSPGESVRLSVERSGRARLLTVPTRASTSGEPRAVVGIGVGTTFKFPFTVGFGLKDVGGPSAGMMFALGIIDKLTPGELNGGSYVAGTGEISPDGTVGAIGGVQQKMVAARRRGADLFLAPAGNCPEVSAATPDGLTVAKVASLADALAALEALREGTEASLPTCG